MLWAFNPTAHKQLATFVGPAGILFLLLAAVLALAGTGWFKHRLWAWRLAVAVIATPALGGLVNFFRGEARRFWLQDCGCSVVLSLTSGGQGSRRSCHSAMTEISGGCFFDNRDAQALMQKHGPSLCAKRYRCAAECAGRFEPVCANTGFSILNQSASVRAWLWKVIDSEV
jgi:hypothetical protein